MPPHDLTPDLKVAVRLGAELFDRSCRIKQYLDRIGPGESDEHLQLLRSIRRALDDVEQVTIDSFAEVWETCPDDGSRPPAVATLHSSLRRFSDWFGKIHELLVFLPRESISPELVFSLQRCFREFCEEHHPSIVLGSVVNAFEFDFIAVLKERLVDIGEIFPPDERNVVLQLAICDADSPLAYAILGHEVGHAIDSQHGISSGIVSQLDADPVTLDILRSWCAELCADLVAARALGPSPILSLLSMEYCFFPAHFICAHSETHPSTRTRLHVVAEDFAGSCPAALIESEVEFYRTAWRLNFEREFPDPVERKEQKDAHESLSSNLILQMADRVREKLPEIGLGGVQFDADSIARCINRLRSESPVSAQGKTRQSLRLAVKAHEERAFDSQEERQEAFQKLCSEFAERPLEIREILLSGHLRRSERIAELYTVDRPLSSKTSVAAFCASLTKLDRLVGSSIVTTCVHENVLRRLKGTRG